jgi:two-component system chemotaxis response regulator CheB
VVGTAVDPYAARDKIKELQPDVLTLDIEMPRMDGLTFLQLIMEHRPMPVIIMSSLSRSSARAALEALRLGRVDVLSKPDGPYSFGDLGPQLIEMVKAAAGARCACPPARVADASPATGRRPPKGPPVSISVTDQRAIILLGASTGGTEALRDVLRQLPCNLPPIASCSTSRRIFPRRSPSGSTSSAASRCARPRTATGSAPAWPCSRPATST